MTGFAYPLRCHKAHLFGPDGVSLCGRWTWAGQTRPIPASRPRPLVAKRRECQACCIAHNRAAAKEAKGCPT